MPEIFLYVESKTQNKRTGRRETDTYTENILTVARWKSSERMGEKRKGIKYK